ncbi:MAG: DUF4870 domain-containing protein [Povalibacter sp.]
MSEVSIPSPTVEERNWAMLAHLSALLGLVVWGAGIVLGPLIVWLIKRDTLPFVNDQGTEALNFQITVFLAGVVCTALIFLLIGIPLLAALALFDLIFVIIAAVKVSEGVAYRYPICLRLIK